MPQTFGKLIGKKIQEKLLILELSQVDVVRKTLGLDLKTSDSDLTEEQVKEFRNRRNRLSELIKGKTANPKRRIYKQFCEVLGIENDEIEQIRAQAFSTEPQLVGWPDLITTEVPANLVARDFRQLVLGTTAVQEAEQAYENVSQCISVHPHGVGVYDPDVNEFFLRSELSKLTIPVKLDDKYLAYDVNNVEDCQLLSYIQNEKTKHGAQLFNSKKIRLSSSVSNKIGEAVYLRETDYCSSLITDQLAFQEIYIDDPNVTKRKVLRDGLDEFIRNGKLIALDDTERMSNQIGASTIAFSSDGKLLHVEQTRQNAQSMGLLAPSGSGSLDWEDMFHGRTEKSSDLKTDLLSIVSTGAARELIEECGLHIQHSKDDPYIGAEEVSEQYLKVFGFSRMLHRGGKPEFYCVAVLPFDQFEVEKAKLSKNEMAYTRRTLRSQATKIDFSGSLEEIRQSIIDVCESFMGPYSVDMLKKNRELDFLSFPLSHALELLIKAVNGPSGDELLNFLMSASKRSADQS